MTKQGEDLFINYISPITRELQKNCIAGYFFYVVDRLESMKMK